jgi:uncharacterized protein YbaP (TraB family)
MAHNHPVSPCRISDRVIRYVGIGVLALFVAAAAGRTGARAPALEAAQKTCLWAVEFGANRVFLLGSIHYLRADAYPLPSAINAAYADSRVIVFETDITRMQDPSVQTRMLELGTYPKGQSVFNALGADTRQQLRQKLAQAGLPAEVVEGLKPWLVALTLSSLEFMRLGFDPNLGVDMHYYKRAQSDGKKIAALEAVENQLELLAGMNARAQEKFLSQTLQELDQVPRMAADLFALWRAGRTEALYRLLFETIDRYPEIRDRMLVRRNQAWLEKIEDLIRRREAALVIVGAMHLIGPGSVVDLLQKRGYRVEQQ